MLIRIHYADPKTSPGDVMFVTGLGARGSRIPSLLCSVSLHVLGLTVALVISLLTPPIDIPRFVPVPPTEIRIQGHVYMVSELPQITPVPVPASPSPKRLRPEGVAKLRPGKAAQSASAASAAPKAEASLASNAEPRLLQPAFLRVLSPDELDLPDFRIWMRELQRRRSSKPFIVPGRGSTVGVTTQEWIEPPKDLAVARTEAPALPNAHLLLPVAAPPSDPVPQTAERPGVSPDQIGEPIQVLSMNSRSNDVRERLLVPAGSTQPGEQGIEWIPGRGRESNASREESLEARAARELGRGEGRIEGRGESREAIPSETANNSSASNRSASGNASVNRSANASAEGTAGKSETAEARGESSGKGSAKEGSASASAGSSATSSQTSSATSGTGASANKAADAANTQARVIVRPKDGNFDAVIVQSSPVQFEETHLLKGRPIYSVYIAVGTAKDWILYYSMPEETASHTVAGPVVTLGRVATVRPPWPTRMLVPTVSLPAGEKYTLIHGVVGPDGAFRELRIVRPGSAEFNESLLHALQDWEFRAATRDGVPIAVEAVLSIPAGGL